MRTVVGISSAVPNQFRRPPREDGLTAPPCSLQTADRAGEKAAHVNGTPGQKPSWQSDQIVDIASIFNANLTNGVSLGSTATIQAHYTHPIVDISKPHC